MPVIDYDVRCETAETWTRRFTWTASGVDVPLADATATFTVKSDIDGDAILTLSSGSGITLADGVIDISITDAQIRTALAGLTVTQGLFSVGLCDLVITYPDTTTKVFFSGKFVVRRSVFQ